MDYPFVDIHTHSTGAPYPSIFSVRLGYDEIPLEGLYSAGVHPWDGGSADDGWLAGIESPRLRAIGEIGLDYACDVDSKLQQQWFERQLALACDLSLPVVVHCVKAYNELIETVDRHPLKKVIIHGFTGSPQLAAQIVGKGYMLSFGRHLADSPKTAEAFSTTPLESLFFETDTFAGGVDEIYSLGAELKRISPEALKKKVYTNYCNVFN